VDTGGGHVDEERAEKTPANETTEVPECGGGKNQVGARILDSGFWIFDFGRPAGAD
jgi:hypothetical protein